MKPNPKDRRNVWLETCLFFLASGCFFLGSSIGSDPYHLFLVAGILNWITGFVYLVRLRPVGTAQVADAAGAPHAVHN